MIVYHSLNVTISSLTLKLKFLVIVKSRVISLCHYLNFVLCISRLCVYSLKLQFGMIIVFKWESKPALKIQMILFFFPETVCCTGSCMSLYCIQSVSIIIIHFCISVDVNVTSLTGMNSWLYPSFITWRVWIIFT